VAIFLLVELTGKLVKEGIYSDIEEFTGLSECRRKRMFNMKCRKRDTDRINN